MKRLSVASIPHLVRSRLPKKAEKQDLTFQVTTPLPTASKNTNLPAQTIPLVGREDELAGLAKLLDDPSNRLVTIVGPGGMGKTRLSLEVGTQQISQFADGVYFVELAPLSTPEHIVSAIADVIGVQFAAGSEPKQQLLDSFHNRKMLLLMDNFEHLLEGAQIVGEILRAAPNVKVLATSCERLNLSAETLFVLSGMDFPDWETSEDALQYGAVKLFMQSARRIKSDFELKADDLVHVARICRLVQGLPLGILLAAAAAGTLSVKEIAQEISQNFDFLETEMRDVPERQRSIRAVFDYSWRLLNEQERNVFMRPSVFRGGFTREAAQDVAGASLKTLMGLMNKSLLRRDLDGRYQIHELLRQYGEQQLDKAGKTAAAQEPHATFYAQLLKGLWQDLKGPRQVGALAEIDPEFENIRVAWLWLVANQRVRELGASASSLWFYLEISARYFEGIDLYDHAIDNLRTGAQPAEDKWVLGHLLGCLAWFQGGTAQLKKCKASANEALTILRDAQHPEEQAMALFSKMRWSARYDEYIDLERSEQETLLLAQGMGNAWAKFFQGGAYVGAGKLEEGQRITREGLDYALALGDLWSVGTVSIVLGTFERGHHNLEEAERLARLGLNAFEALHNRFGIADACVHLGSTLAYQGRETEAKAYLQRSIKTSYDMGVVRTTLTIVLTCLENYFAQVNKPFAVELLAMILNNPACDSIISGWTEKTTKRLSDELPKEVYETAWKRGEKWSFDQAVDLILAQLS